MNDLENRFNTLLMKFMIYPKVEVSDDFENLSIIDLQNMKFKEILLNECVISVGKEKNIVCTTIQGRAGTVKEYISDDDYQITLDIGLNNFNFSEESNSFEYPIKSITEFVEMLQLGIPIILNSEFLNVFEIDTAIVKSYNLQQETHSNRQSIVVNMISENDYLIKIREGEK